MLRSNNSDYENTAKLSIKFDTFYIKQTKLKVQRNFIETMVQIVHTTILTVLSIQLMLIVYINIDFPSCIFFDHCSSQTHTPSHTLDIVHFLNQHAKISLDI